jgi:hypothetical protein
LDPRARQLRAALRRASSILLHAEADLEEASRVVATAFLRTDTEEWIVATSKRSAALGR